MASKEDKKSLSSPSPSDEFSRLTHEPIPASHRGSKQVNWETDISVDDRGSVTFHNSTSAMHEPPLGADGTSAMSLGQVIAIASGSEDEQVKRSLVMNAQTQRQWEDFAVGNTAVKLNIPKELSDELLKYHWCWIHPLFIFVSERFPRPTRNILLMLNLEQVYRPAFIRMYLSQPASDATNHPKVECPW
jgi:hypothetical protein